MWFFTYVLILMAGSAYGLSCYRLLPRPYRLLTQMLMITLISELLSHFLKAQIGTNYPFYHVLQVIQILYYGGIFYFLIRNFEPKPRWVMYIAIAFSVVSIIVSMAQSIFTFPSIGNILLSFYVVIMALILFVKMVKTPEETRILSQPPFWLGSGSLFFYSITFFIFGYFDFLVNSGLSPPKWANLLVYFSNFILYGSYLMTLYLAAKKPNRPTS